jgi:hypothetical protein
MSDNLKALNRDDILLLLVKVDAELASNGHRAVVYVVGGANIALAIDNTRSTTDVDVVIKRGAEQVRAAAARVAADEPGLGADWLNSEFQGDSGSGITWQWFDQRDQDKPITIHEGDGLTVELASAEMMLALKTLAGRPRDMADIHQLMRLTDIRTREDLGRNLARFTGRRIFDAQGSPGMFLRIDPEFREIYAYLPEDLRAGWEGEPSGDGGWLDRLRKRRASRRARP